MALESVDFSEDRACQILNIVQQDDQIGPKPKADKTPNSSTKAST